MIQSMTGYGISHWDRYLGMMTAMTQVPVPTTVNEIFREVLAKNVKTLYYFSFNLSLADW